MTHHYKAIAVEFDGITINTFRYSTGEYLIPHGEISRIFSASEYEILALVGGDSYLLNMAQFQRVALTLAQRGNTEAAAFVETMACEGMLHRFQEVK